MNKVQSTPVVDTPQTITVRGQQYTPADARALARELDQACAAVTPADPVMLEVLAQVAQENGVELWEAASVAGVELEGINAADATKLAMTLTHNWEENVLDHLWNTMERKYPSPARG